MLAAVVTEGLGEEVQVINALDLKSYISSISDNTYNSFMLSHALFKD